MQHGRAQDVLVANARTTYEYLECLKQMVQVRCPGGPPLVPMAPDRELDCRRYRGRVRRGQHPLQFRLGRGPLVPLGEYLHPPILPRRHPATHRARESRAA